MANDPEAQTQLARLLRDDSLRSASARRLSEAVDAGLDTLANGLVSEAAASDDVVDQESARSFVRLRLDTLRSVLTEEQTSRLLAAVQGKIEAW